MPDRHLLVPAPGEGSSIALLRSNPLVGRGLERLVSLDTVELTFEFFAVRDNTLFAWSYSDFHGDRFESAIDLFEFDLNGRFRNVLHVPLLLPNDDPMISGIERLCIASNGVTILGWTNDDILIHLDSGALYEGDTLQTCAFSREGELKACLVDLPNECSIRADLLRVKPRFVTAINYEKQEMEGMTDSAIWFSEWDTFNPDARDPHTLHAYDHDGNPLRSVHASSRWWGYDFKFDSQHLWSWYHASNQTHISGLSHMAQQDIHYVIEGTTPFDTFILRPYEFLRSNEWSKWSTLWGVWGDAICFMSPVWETHLGSVLMTDDVVITPYKRSGHQLEECQSFRIAGIGAIGQLDLYEGRLYLRGKKQGFLNAGSDVMVFDLSGTDLGRLTPRVPRKTAVQYGLDIRADRITQEMVDVDAQDNASVEMFANPVHAPSEHSGLLSLETLVSTWANIRAQVNSLDRRTNALLMEIEPVDIAENRITLVSPYEFHRNMLNEASRRSLVESVISRQFGKPCQIEVMLLSDFAAKRSLNLPAYPISDEPIGPFQVVVHNISRATIALSLVRYLQGLDQFHSAEPREYAGGVLRLEIVSDRRVVLEDLQGWSEATSLELISESGDRIEMNFAQLSDGSIDDLPF